MQTLNNQYQQNIEFIKGFFRKPIVLAMGIFTLLGVVAETVASVLLSTFMAEKVRTFFQYIIDKYGHLIEKYDYFVEVDTNPTLSIDIFAILIGVAFVLLFVHSRSNSNKILGSSRFYRILMNIQFVVGIVAAVFCVLAMITTLVIPVFAPIIKTLVVIAILLAVFLIIGEAYSVYSFAKSISSSMNSVYLSSKGAKATGVFMFLSGIGNITSVITMLSFDVDIAIVALNAVNVIPPFLLGIMAFMYDSYIKSICQGTYTAPTPQPVGQAYATPGVCLNCGTAVTQEDVFCHVCGNKLK